MSTTSSLRSPPTGDSSDSDQTLQELRAIQGSLPGVGGERELGRRRERRMRAGFLDPRREARDHSHEHEVRRNHGAWSERIDRQFAVAAQGECCPRACCARRSWQPIPAFACRTICRRRSRAAWACRMSIGPSGDPSSTSTTLPCRPAPRCSRAARLLVNSTPDWSPAPRCWRRYASSTGARVGSRSTFASRAR